LINNSPLELFLSFSNSFNCLWSSAIWSNSSWFLAESWT
jgi:hypothetical protein